MTGRAVQGGAADSEPPGRRHGLAAEERALLDPPGPAEAPSLPAGAVMLALTRSAMSAQ